MNKKEYAMLHYLLAKLKYDLAKDMFSITNKKLINKNRSLIESINELEKLIFIDGGDK